MEERYHSVRSETSAQIKVEGSRFIADVMPAGSEDEAKSKLEAVRKKYYDATHHCYAYSVGAEKRTVRASDDGEPSGTAGIKIQSAIQAKGLSDILVVVTRYYGGTKLGVGGLGRAYFESAELALSQAPTVPKAVIRELRVTFPFPETNPVMNIITAKQLKVAGTEYTGEDATVTLHLLPSMVDTVSGLITDATRGHASLQTGELRTVVWK
jgi:uncharacterized YigZ family protein